MEAGSVSALKASISVADKKLSQNVREFTNHSLGTSGQIA